MIQPYCIDQSLPLTGVLLADVVPLTLQQHGADVVLTLQQQKGVQITAEHTEQSAATHKHQHIKNTFRGLAWWDIIEKAAARIVQYCRVQTHRQRHYLDSSGLVCLQVLDQSTHVFSCQFASCKLCWVGTLGKSFMVHFQLLLMTPDSSTLSSSSKTLESQRKLRLWERSVFYKVSYLQREKAPHISYLQTCFKMYIKYFTLNNNQCLST